MRDTVPCSYRLTREEYTALKAIADADDRKLAYIVRKAIQRYIVDCKEKARGAAL